MSTIDDLFSAAVTTASHAAIDAWNKTQMAFLSHGAKTPDHLADALKADGDLAIAHASRGLFSLLLGRRELFETARQSERAAIDAARKRPVTVREQAYIDALAAWNRGQAFHSASLLEDVLNDHPHDGLAMKLVQAIRFVLGDARGMRSSVEFVLPSLCETHPAYGYALGCHAFALEETGEYQLAERIGREAVKIAPDDAWGLHAVAHVYDMTNNTTAGIEWLSNRPQAWAHCNNFRYHVWWHLALLHLDRGEIGEVFRLYDRSIRADRTDDYRDISNAASLLSRLELEGYSVGDRWSELADISERRLSDGCLAFADLHYLLALIGGDREAAVGRLLRRMARDGASQCDMMRVINKPGLDAAQGLEAFGEGNYSRAFRHLAGARSDMQTVGGSHAQRDVFERLTIEAALRGGYFDAAERFLDDRAAKRAGKEDAFAARCYAQLNEGRKALSTPDLVPAI